MKTNIVKPTVMENPDKLEIADIFQRYGEVYRRNKTLPYDHIKVMHRIETCRTAALGGHVEQCDQCAFERIAYNSCRDRHCPKCQSMAKERWLNDRKAELLPCGYFHLVFTLPHNLNPIILCNKSVALQILFTAVSQTLQAFAKDPQWKLEGRLGFISVLHTWSQTLLDHFHLHCLIPGGAFSFCKTRWTASSQSYLFRIESLAKEFKKRYLTLLKKAHRKLIFPGRTAEFESQKNFYRLIDDLFKVKWMAYAKRPFAGPEQVLEYLGRYTHRVAISNNRIKSIDDGRVTFEYRDRSRDNEVKQMSLAVDEFIRRFLLHVLPSGFMKIRYFGFLANNCKKQMIPLLRRLINPNTKLPEKTQETAAEIILRLTGEDITCCPQCKKGKMRMITKLPIQTLNSS